MPNTLDTILYYLDISYKRKLILIVSIVLCTIIGALLGWKMPLYYRSTTMILVEKQQVPEAYVTPTDRTPFNQRLGTITQQIISRQNLESIISEYKLYQKDPLKSNWADVLNKIGIKMRTAPLKEEMLEQMIADIEVEVIGDRRAGDAFSITYTGTTPQIAMEVANKLASLFITQNLKVREEYAEGTSDFLANELKAAKDKLEEQEKAVRNFKERNMGTLPQQLDANLRTLDRLQTELQSINLEIKNAEDRKMILESQLNQGDGTGAGMGQQTNPIVVELTRLQNELASLLSVYNENYPDVAITKKRINELKELLATSNAAKSQSNIDELEELSLEERNPEIFNNLVVVQNQIETLKLRHANTMKQVKMYEARVEATPASEQKFADLRRDYDMSINNYQALLEKKLSAQLAENLEKRQKGERFRVLDPANLPEKPYKPKKFTLTVMGFGAGGGLGFAIVLLLESLNPVFRNPEELEEALRVKVLSTIPDFNLVNSSGSKKG